MNETCRRVLSDLEAYLDGELDDSACRRLEAHAAECAACATDVHGLRRTIGMCRDAARAPLPDTVRARAREAVRRLLDRDPVSGASERRKG